MKVNVHLRDDVQAAQRRDQVTAGQDGTCVDSEAWTCQRCHGQMIGGRTPDDLCRQCIAASLATPAARAMSDPAPVVRSLATVPEPSTSLPAGGPSKPAGQPMTSNVRRNLLIRLGDLGCPHDTRDLSEARLVAHLGDEAGQAFMQAGPPRSELRSYTCPACGVHASYPGGNARNCGTCAMVQLRSHETVARARRELLSYQDAEAGRPRRLAAEPMAIELAALLALIDERAGAAS